MFKGLVLLVGGTLLTCAGAQAQDIFALPGSNSGTTANVYSINPIIAVTSFTTGSGAFLAAAKPDGSKYYVIGTSPETTVTVVDGSFSNPKFIGNFSQQPTAAVLTPDGSRLAIAAGVLEIIDTTSDNITPLSSVNASDVAVSLDGSRIFALGLSVSGSTLTAVDPNQNAVVATLPIGGQATGVSVGPNGLVYVSTQNQIIEINPATLTATSSGTIQLNARPGKVVFTPDGLHAVAVNLTPQTGSAALLINLSTHTVLNTIPNFAVTLDTLSVASNGTVFAYSNQTASLYQITVASNGGFGINPLSIPGITGNNIGAFALSDEVASGAVSTAKYLFLAPSNRVLYRIDLNANQIGSQVPTPNTVGALSYVTPALTNAQPATLLAYGTSQTINPGATSLPLVVRALDASGHPIGGITITFATDHANAKLKFTQVTTGANGFAVNSLIAPSVTGPVHVTATAGGLTANYTVSVGSSSGGSAAQISIVAGQGQILFENQNTGIPGFGSPLVVKVADVSGNPVVGTKVTFTTAVGGAGNISGGTGTGVQGQATSITDSNGLASVNFLSVSFATGAAFVQGQVTAKAPNTNTVTFYVTTTHQFPVSPTIQLLKPAAGQVIGGQAGSVLKGVFSIQVVSGLGTAIPNASLIIVDPNNPKNTPAASCVDPTGGGVLTDSTGTATCDLMLGGTLGSSAIAGSVGYLNVTRHVIVNITPGAPGKLNKIQGDNQSGKPGTPLPNSLVVQISDAFGNLLPGIPVTFTPSSGVTLSNVISTTDSTGKASANATLGSVVGPQTVTVAAGGITTAFSLAVLSPAAKIQIVSGNSQTTLINTAFASPLVVQVTDSQGSVVSGAAITFSVTGGLASILTPNTTTDATGTASTTVQAGQSPGPISITALVSGTNVSTTFTLSANTITAGAVQIVSGDGQTARENTAFAQPLVVNVTDAHGNPAPGLAVTFAVTSARAQPTDAAASPINTATATLGTPTATTDANGNASTTVTAGATPGTLTITATSGSFSVAFNLTVIPPGPAIKSIVNGASFQSGISPGSIATINGTGIAIGLQGVVTSGAIVGPLQTSLAGVTVTFNGIAAPIYSVSNISGKEQVTVQVPFEVTPGSASLIVTVNGGSTALNVPVKTLSPGIFELAGAGHFAVLVRPDGSYVSQDNPIQRGETIVMFVTGLGQTTPPIGTNQAGVPNQNVAATITVGVNGGGEHAISATTLPGVVGVYEVAFEVPADNSVGASEQFGLSVKDSSGKSIFAQSVFAPVQ